MFNPLAMFSPPNPASMLADNAMVTAARAKVSLGREAYSTIDARMKGAPKSKDEAYEQAIYYIAFAARRCLREGKTGPYTLLMVELEDLQAQASKDSGSLSSKLSCNSLGVGCDTEGLEEPLEAALYSIQTNSIPTDDEVLLSQLIQGNIADITWQRRKPYVIGGIAVALAVTAGLFWSSKRD